MLEQLDSVDSLLAQYGALRVGGSYEPPPQLLKYLRVVRACVAVPLDREARPLQRQLLHLGGLPRAEDRTSPRGCIPPQGTSQRDRLPGDHLGNHVALQ